MPNPITRKDSVDFRDRIYQPALVPLAVNRIPEPGLLNIRNQGMEGACTGFGLAAVVDFLGTERATREGGAFKPVSARMLYEMAKLHDRWPGEEYEGSSIRGAMKGWHKNGVCPEAEWKYSPDKPGYLNVKRRTAALDVPLGAYYRVMPKRSDLHAALNEVPAILASAATHPGWSAPKDGVIPHKAKGAQPGGHAFAIIGYTERGFIIQNSWGRGWGGVTLEERELDGVAIWTYEDFEENLWDAWVARMALPVKSLSALAGGRFESVQGGTKKVEKGPPRHEIASHYVHIDDGRFDPKGDYPSRPEEVAALVKQACAGGADHIVLYAHGGLNRVKAAASRAGKWRRVFQANNIHEIHFIWETGAVAEIRDILLGKEVFADERAGGVTDWTDRWLERMSQPVGHALWREMRSDAEIAFAKKLPDGGKPAGVETLALLNKSHAAQPAGKRPKLHLVGHSAGSILFGHLLTAWARLGGPAFENLILFAPACTHDFVDAHIAPALGRSKAGVDALHHFLLTDEAELDDNVGFVYRKSLLYLVSRSYQRKSGDPVELMGMAKFEKALRGKLDAARYSAYLAPKEPAKTGSRSHGGFDNDLATMNEMLSLVLGKKPASPFKKKDLEGY